MKQLAWTQEKYEWRKIADSIKLSKAEAYALTAVCSDWKVIFAKNPCAFVVLVNRTLGKNYSLTVTVE